MKCAEPIKKLSNVKLNSNLDFKSIIDKSSAESINRLLNEVGRFRKGKVLSENIGLFGGSEVVGCEDFGKALASDAERSENVEEVEKELKKELEMKLKLKTDFESFLCACVADGDCSERSSCIVIRYSNNVIKKIELTEIEVFILKAAVLYNRGFINLLSMRRRHVINNLFNKGLVTIEASVSNNDAGLVRVTREVYDVFRANEKIGSIGFNERFATQNDFIPVEVKWQFE